MSSFMHQCKTKKKDQYNKKWFSFTLEKANKTLINHAWINFS